MKHPNLEKVKQASCLFTEVSVTGWKPIRPFVGAWPPSPSVCRGVRSTGSITAMKQASRYLHEMIESNIVVLSGYSFGEFGQQKPIENHH